MKVNKYINPYVSSKSSDSFGIQHGPGLPGKTGIKKGTFTEDDDRKFKPLNSKPPRKLA